MKSITYYSGVLILSLLPFVTTQAANINWQNPDGGSFGTPGNWSNGVPGTADYAIFGPDKSDPEEGDSYTVTLDQNRTLTGLHFNAGDKSHLILDLGGHSLNLTSTNANNAAFIVSNTENHSRTVTLLNGTFSAGQARIVGLVAATEEEGRLIVGNGAVYHMTGETRVANSAGNAYLRVEGTGSVQAAALLILGRFGGSSGRMEVTGANASLTGAGALYVGSEGAGHLQILNGATLNKSGNLYMASGAGGEGLLEVTGESSFTLGGFLQIARSAGDSTARAVFSSGTTAQMDRITMHANGTLEINGATVTATGATTNEWNADSVYRVYLNALDATPLSLQSILLNEVVLDVDLGDGFVADLGNQYSLIQYSGNLTGLFVDTEGAVMGEGTSVTIGDYVFELSYGTGVNSMVSLELVAVPEPAHAVLLLVVVLGGYTIWGQRKKRVRIAYPS